MCGDQGRIFRDRWYAAFRGAGARQGDFGCWRGLIAVFSAAAAAVSMIPECCQGLSLTTLRDHSKTAWAGRESAAIMDAPPGRRKPTAVTQTIPEQPDVRTLATQAAGATLTSKVMVSASVS